MRPRLSKELHDFPLFAGLHDDDLRQIQRVSSLRSMEKGRFVFLRAGASPPRAAKLHP